MTTILIKYLKAGKFHRMRFKGNSYEEANEKLVKWRSWNDIEIVELEVK